MSIGENACESRAVTNHLDKRNTLVDDGPLRPVLRHDCVEDIEREVVLLLTRRWTRFKRGLLREGRYRGRAYK
jgi:hypothetical protein